MKFGVFYEHQLPKPWGPGDEARLFHQALEQVVLADRLGFDYAWEVEHHFLDEYSHSSAPEVFLAAAAALTTRIPPGPWHPPGDRQLQPPARTAETLSTLDIISHGRVDFGIGEGATRLELGGFRIPAKEKRAMCLEAAEQIANMMVLDPYPGFEGASFSMPCRNVLPKPVQQPHPPMWMACTNRDTIRVAASQGIGALAFSFVDPGEAKVWAEIYYGIIKSDQCVPIGPRGERQHGHGVQLLAPCRPRRGGAAWPGGLRVLPLRGQRPGGARHGPRPHPSLGRVPDSASRARRRRGRATAGGRRHPHHRHRKPRTNMRRHLEAFQDAGIDQVIFLQQAGRNRHEHICESLELFAAEVMPKFQSGAAAREARKAADLAPHIAAALARKRWMKPLADEDIPVVKASVVRAQINQPATT